MEKIQDSFVLKSLTYNVDDHEKLVLVITELTDYVFRVSPLAPEANVSGALIDCLHGKIKNFWYIQPTIPKALRSSVGIINKNLRPLSSNGIDLSETDKIISKYFPG